MLSFPSSLQLYSMSRAITLYLHTLFAFQEVSTYSNNPCSLTPEEYFDQNLDLGERDIGRPVEQATKTQRLKAVLWLAEEYPLSLQEQVVPIIDLMAASNAHFRKLKDFITLQLPAGFPVKIGRFSYPTWIFVQGFIVTHARMCVLVGGCEYSSDASFPAIARIPAI